VKVVNADIAEGWVKPPTRHLPFVPCRILPRNVVMQEKTRLRAVPDGGPPEVESYLKPRVTTNSSAGGDQAVNAWVPQDERELTLPTVQHHARSLAICDTAGDQHTRAASYVVDAESAFRFLPIQEADLWTQCFMWWGEGSETGTSIDLTMGFGGAFSPNRFERVSTLAAAHIQAKQAAFDASHAGTPSMKRWTAERSALRSRGALPDAEHQLTPCALQVYIE
jgi:hypothetical protein